MNSFDRRRSIQKETAACQVRREQYMERYNLVPRKNSDCCVAHKLLAVSCPNRREYYYCCDRPCGRPPQRDHTEFFKRPDGKLMFTSQPYMGRAIQGANIEAFKVELEAWAASFGLSIRISEEDSWWNPGKTILYEMWKEQS